jgi:hypothetical protein
MGDVIGCVVRFLRFYREIRKDGPADIEWIQERVEWVRSSG